METYIGPHICWTCAEYKFCQRLQVLTLSTRFHYSGRWQHRNNQEYTQEVFGSTECSLHDTSNVHKVALPLQRWLEMEGVGGQRIPTKSAFLFWLSLPTSHRQHLLCPLLIPTSHALFSVLSIHCNLSCPELPSLFLLVIYQSLFSLRYLT